MREEIIHAREGLERLYNASYLGELKAPPVQPVLEQLALRADDVVVELGSGNGHFTLPIARRFEEEQGRGVIFGCDFSRSLVDDLGAKAAAERVDVHLRAVSLGDILPETLPFADASVDMVLSVNVLQYLADPRPYLREIARVLVPGGGMLVADWREPVPSRSGDNREKGRTPEQFYSMPAEVGLESILPLELSGYFWAVQAVRPIVFTV